MAQLGASLAVFVGSTVFGAGVMKGMHAREGIFLTAKAQTVPPTKQAPTVGLNEHVRIRDMPKEVCEDCTPPTLAELEAAERAGETALQQEQALLKQLRLEEAQRAEQAKKKQAAVKQLHERNARAEALEAIRATLRAEGVEPSERTAEEKAQLQAQEAAEAKAEALKAAALEAKKAEETVVVVQEKAEDPLFNLQVEQSKDHTNLLATTIPRLVGGANDAEIKAIADSLPEGIDVHRVAEGVRLLVGDVTINLNFS